MIVNMKKRQILMDFRQLFGFFLGGRVKVNSFCVSNECEVAQLCFHIEGHAMVYVLNKLITFLRER